MLSFKVTVSRDKNKIIFSCALLKGNKLTLSGQIDSMVFVRLPKMTYRNFINSGIRQSAVALAHKMVLFCY
jgi:hypothetical protein